MVFAYSLGLLPAGFGFVYLWLTGRVSCLVSNRQVTVEANGMRVDGEVLEGRTTAIVTRRDPGKMHSYQLIFEGDVDSTGDMGFVVDCHDWLAPHVPFLLETRGYPPCRMLSKDGSRPQCRSLIQAGEFMQFVGEDQSTIRIRR